MEKKITKMRCNKDSEKLPSVKNRQHRQQSCYVCGKAIKGAGQYVGQGLWRHKSKCRPGSDAWLRSSVSKHSRLSRELRILFIKVKKEEKGK
jgi:hypothetical protein